MSVDRLVLWTVDQMVESLVDQKDQRRALMMVECWDDLKAVWSV